MDECLEVVRGLLIGDPLDYGGELFQLEQAGIGPAPAKPVPLLVGGRSTAAIRRAGHLGDRWYGIWVSPRRYGEALESMETALNVWCGVGPTAEDAGSFVAPAMEAFYQVPYERFEKWSPSGTPEHVAAFLAPYVDSGCHTFNVIACGASLEDEVEAVAEIREHLVG